MKKYFTGVVASLLMYTTAFGQYEVKGRIIDSQTKEALGAVSIHIPHTGIGTASNQKGDFKLSAAIPIDTLIVSFTGYTPKTVTAGKNNGIVSLNPSATLLNGIIVSASREAEDRSDAPIAISTISPQTISETKATTLDQLMNTVSGVYMVDLGNEQHTMAIRQPIGYRNTFLYLEDGIPIRATGDFNHNALIEINGAALKRIEVIKGPSSSLYGSDAIGGAVNFITQSPSAIPTASLQLEGSDWGYKRTDFSVSNTLNKTGFYIGGYYANQHGGYMQHSDFNKLALTARVDYEVNDHSKITTEATLINYKTDQTGGLDSAHFYGKDYKSLYTFTYRKVNALRIRTSWEQRWNLYNTTTITGYFRNNSIGQNPFYYIKNTADPLQANGQINDDHFHSFGVIAQHTKRFGFWDTRLIAGITADYSPAGYYANYINIRKNAAGYYTGYANTDSLLTDYNARLLNTAVYTQWETSPVEKLKIVAALRYDRLDYSFNNHLPPSAYSGAPDDKNNFQQLTPKLGFTYAFEKDKGLYANYSIGFAPPDITDLYTGVKVPYLKPARYYNYETGGWFGFADGKGSVEASAYHMNGENEIISVRLADGSYINKNAGRTVHYGIEYTLEYSPVKSILLRFSGTNAAHLFTDYTENGKDYSGKEMNGAPHFIANAEITYKPAYLKGFRIGLTWQHLSKYFMDEANTQYYKGYSVFNTRLGYTFKSFEVWGNIINTGNIIYATSAEKTAYGVSYRPGPLRTLYFGIAYHFTGKTKN